MVEITFIRHGQAQPAARDEHSYDRLSELGQLQAGWLAEHLAGSGRGFDCVVAGRLRRQQATAGTLGAALGLAVETDPRLDEMDYFGLSRSMEESHALAFPSDRAGFLAHLPQVLTAWEKGEIASPAESFAAFEERVGGAIEAAGRRGGRVLMVTSGGVIGMAMRILLRLEVPVYANVLLQIYNTSLHRYVKAGDTLVLDVFNAIPHLETAERAHARTWT
jgi:broad specificity phosphatase PhoE